MLFLTKDETKTWTQLGMELEKNQAGFSDYKDAVRENLAPVFCCFIGGLLCSKGQEQRGAAWFKEGLLIESDEFLFNAFIVSFLERQKGRLVQPAVVFEDPRPYVHFTQTPAMKGARKSFIENFGRSLPKLNNSFRFMDIGCGDGALTAAVLKHLREIGKVGDIEQILLIDRSKAMAEMARKKVSEALPGIPIQTIHSRIEDVADKIDTHFDLAMSSLAYHHMPLEQKVVHLRQLKKWIDHFVLFELDGNNDTPELHSPDLALSIYQAYGRMIDFVFTHDAPLEVAYQCVDCFLMTEAVSLMTEPRGVRNDYHMLKTQWSALFEAELCPDMTLLGDATCYTDDSFALFMLHYGR